MKCEPISEIEINGKLYPASETKRSPFVGIGLAFAVMSLGMVTILIPPVALVFFLAGFLGMFWLPFTMRTAACPNCLMDVMVMPVTTKVLCGRCRHSLGKHGNLVVDFSKDR
ncbi:hypothetical protein [Phenylobacterium sp. SCN 70-31]|uniref:hypothetical protein n=1 Tax=Phenylobacterium sp. SCN 70-31 TaxID=1660129 RepID=UPI00086BCD7A|nr:hypothetical protein [Phenylobacterium sp. SCN 70-31]ODT84841.1 MAG: hypothetical protein ABS78_22045 [Phenylobacterium sp. SCN 70-31]